MDQFDLSGNPLPEVTDQSQPEPDETLESTLPRVPRPYNFATAADKARAFEEPLSDNTSGQGGDVPAAIASLKWNWGAFFLPPTWCASHGYAPLGYVYDLLIVLFVLSPFLYGPLYGTLVFAATSFLMFGISVYLGAKGNEIAWKNRIFDGGLDGFFQIQRYWMITAFAVALPLDLLMLGFIGYGTKRAYEVRLSQMHPVALTTPVQAPASTAPQFMPASNQPVVIIERQSPNGYGTRTPMGFGPSDPRMMNRPPMPQVYQPTVDPNSSTVPNAGTQPSVPSSPTTDPVNQPSVTQPPTAPTATGSPEQPGAAPSSPVPVAPTSSVVTPVDPAMSPPTSTPSAAPPPGIVPGQ